MLHILIRNSKQADLFCNAMQLFADSRDGKASKVDSAFDIRGAHHWDEVVGAVQRAEEVYDTRGSGIGGLHRKIFRAIGDYHDALEPWIELIPTEDHYLSILCGGLKLFLGVSILGQVTGRCQRAANASDQQAAAYRAKERDSILVVFESLGNFRDKVKDWSNIFPTDPIVRHNALQAYLTLLKMIETQLRRLVGERTCT